MIRYILFDLGFVLVELNGMPFFRHNFPELSVVEIHRRWVALDSVNEFETGQIQSEEFFTRVVKDLEINKSPNEFETIFRNWVLGAYPQASELIIEIKKDYPVGCLSNTNPVHIDDLNRKTDLLTLLDHNFYSHEIGIMKPKAGAYHHVLEKIPFAAEEILFLDDSLDNVNMAKDLGIQAQQTVGFEQTIAALKSFKVID